MKVTIGGDRLGAGKKQKVNIENFGRSTFNLSKKVSTSMAPGVLYPVYTNIGLRGDTFKMDINAIARTLPTQGPLFGSFKMQIDVFTCPIRLYQGILHNNPLNLGLNMNKVLLPELDVTFPSRTNPNKYEDVAEQLLKYQKISNSCLLKYLGFSGFGQSATTNQYASRQISALPLLSYYDIFKNYYANKQEKKAYVISKNADSYFYVDTNGQQGFILEQKEENAINYIIQNASKNEINDSGAYIREIWNKNIMVDYSVYKDKELIAVNTEKIEKINKERKYLQIQIDNINYEGNGRTDVENNFINITENYIIQINNIFYDNRNNPIQLLQFDLENIDKMRYRILSSNQLGQRVSINNTETLMPYMINTKCWNPDNNIYSAFMPNSVNLNGLCVKTYQNDIFNAWLNTEIIDGENGINEITRVKTEDGSFSIDSLRLANKINKMLNKIALSGGTYQDWQDVVYTENAARIAESPIYWGGCSYEIAFEEVVQTSAAETSAGESQLGTLGGRGKLFDKKEGNVIIKIEEASIIMVIASITPRVSYTQGNKWYLTDIWTPDDFHKPDLDGIGFQDVITEQAAYWDTNSEDGKLVRSAIGKTLSWQNYRTDFDEAYGDFAEDADKAFMILQRDYAKVFDKELGIFRVKDLTTYIDPSKFNYAFAYNEIDAQNFWVQIQFDIEARRIMAARQIPSLN